MSAGDSKVLLPSGAFWCAACPAVRSVRVDSVEDPGAEAPDLSQAVLRAPSPLCPPLVQHVEELVAHDGVDVNFAALRTAGAAAGVAGAARAAGVLV